VRAVIEKRCSRCGETKMFWDFSRSLQTTDGLHGWCKVCRSEYARVARVLKVGHFPDPQLSALGRLGGRRAWRTR
jgi:hypothetical protein